MSLLKQELLLTKVDVQFSFRKYANSCTDENELHLSFVQVFGKKLMRNVVALPFKINRFLPFRMIKY